MLIEFSVTNYGPILDRQTLSMRSHGAHAELDENVIAVGKDKLLRSAAIYGPNASGKSTLLRALDFMQDCVILSAKYAPGDKIDAVPFKLTKATRDADSKFEVVFLEQGVRYEYGFTCNSQRFTGEWLHAFPSGRKQQWFERAFDGTQTTYRYGSKFETQQRQDSYQELSSEVNLYLSVAVMRNSQQLRPVYSWFKDRLRVFVGKEFPGSDFTAASMEDVLMKARVKEYLQAADIGLADLQLEKERFSETAFPAEMPSELRALLSKHLGGKDQLKPVFVRNDLDNGSAIRFEFDEESDGTQSLFALLGPLIDVISNDKVLLVDELDCSLHPHLVHQLISFFNASHSKAQLIFSTHDTSVLGRKLLRRDQIWLMERDRRGAARLFRLSEFSVRENEAIERGYLGGRYGGVPILAELTLHETD